MVVLLYVHEALFLLVEGSESRAFSRLPLCQNGLGCGAWTHAAGVLCRRRMIIPAGTETRAAVHLVELIPFERIRTVREDLQSQSLTLSAVATKVKPIV